MVEVVEVEAEVERRNRRRTLEQRNNRDRGIGLVDY